MIDGLVRGALAALGIEQLVLAIHDVSFPSDPDEDVGRGSPYSAGARRFFAFARRLGFSGVQLGPQGQTSLGNLSPYDGSVFSRSPTSLPLAALASGERGALLSPELVERLVAATPPGDARAHHAHAFHASEAALASALATLRDRLERGDAGARALETDVGDFVARSPWVVHDARFEAFASVHGTDDFRRWPAADRAPTDARIAEVTAERRDAFDAWVLGQALLDREHTALRARLRSLGLLLYGDHQIGLSLRDRWARGSLFFPSYAMGAPPSRTNPDGQPWAYPVLDPRQYGTRGSPVLAFVRARVDKTFAEFDGVRIDHPHGLVCPWVYDANTADPLEAVAHGARLFETPAPFAYEGAAPHPALAEVAIARADQIDPSVPAYDDHRARGLDDAQIERYSRLFDLVMERAGAGAVLCEVLSTCPAPLARVMQRHRLGRFRVTQKASLVDPRDPYRGENASPRDWTMLGNHDTAPILRVIDRWRRAGTIEPRAAYLATRLEPDPARRDALARWLSSHASRLATGMFAELFVGPAAHVLVFWADLFGERDVYNTPGDTSADNWSMRVPRAFEATYRARARAGDALDVPSALALALHARGIGGPLRAALEERAIWKLE